MNAFMVCVLVMGTVIPCLLLLGLFVVWVVLKGE